MIDPTKLKTLAASLPLAHKLMALAAITVIVLAAAAFLRWVAQPSYAMLYADLEPADVAEVVDELESRGIDYQLEASQVLVPREDLHQARASLAGAGVSATPEVPGYELMDEQGLSVSEFRQQVDYQRALEGELTRTIQAMSAVDSASVHLSVPEQEVFADRQDPVTASVMLGTRSELPPEEVESVAFLVASAVEGLDADQVTVTDTEGRTLHSPDMAGSSAGMTSRQLRQTREFEQALSTDVEQLLRTIAGDDRSSVVVRAALDFDEREVESETRDPDSQIALREQETAERYEGTNVTPGGAVGLDGGPLEGVEGEIDYESEDQTTEYGVDRVVERVVGAPGAVDALSVAVVMDDGTVTGAEIPPLAEIDELLTAALGLDAERGDEIAVTALPFPELDEDEPEAAEAGSWSEQLPAIVAALVIVLIALALFLMARRRRGATRDELLQWEPVADRHAGQLTAPMPVAAPAPAVETAAPEEPRALEYARAQRATEELGDLVDQQPEEIAELLRSWLADDS